MTNSAKTAVERTTDGAFDATLTKAQVLAKAGPLIERS
jgi:hypothetical protein